MVATHTFCACSIALPGLRHAPIYGLGMRLRIRVCTIWGTGMRLDTKDYARAQ